MFKSIAIIVATAMSAFGAFAQELQPTSLATPQATSTEVQHAAAMPQKTGEQLDGDVPHEAPSVVQRYQAPADLDTARAADAWPVRESNDAQRYTAAGGSRHAKRRPRKEYPNVMGMSIHEWLASRQ